MTSSNTNAVRANLPITEPFLVLDNADCKERLGKLPIHFQHQLCGHPLLTLESLAKLADRLPADELECWFAESLVEPDIKSAVLDNPGEAVMNIQSGKFWLALRDVQQIPEYAKLVEQVLGQAETLLPAREGKMRLKEAFIFLTAPGKPTPAHIDPEHNFLVQITGSKQLSIGELPSREAEIAAIEGYLAGGRSNLTEVPPLLETVELKPGSGIYIPPWRPHWVVNGPEYSISMAFTFRTEHSQRREYAHLANIHLRRLGMKPTAVGVSLWRDNLKSRYIGSKRMLRELVSHKEQLRKY